MKCVKRKRPHHGMINHTRNEIEDKLDQQLKDLEEEWDYIKHSKQKNLGRYSTGSSIKVTKALQLLHNSPRSLMSSLQQSWSPWNVRNNNDLAVMEILRERRAAIESGKLKGRRLFQVPDGVTEVGPGEREEIWSGWNGLNQDSEVRSVRSYGSGDDQEEGTSHSSSNSTSDLHGGIAEKKMKEREIKEVVVEKATLSGRKWMDGLGWIVVVMVLSVCAVLGTISVRSIFGYKDEDEVILVPT